MFKLTWAGGSCKAMLFSSNFESDTHSPGGL